MSNNLHKERTMLSHEKAHSDLEQCYVIVGHYLNIVRGDIEEALEYCDSEAASVMQAHANCVICLFEGMIELLDNFTKNIPKKKSENSMLSVNGYSYMDPQLVETRCAVSYQSFKNICFEIIQASELEPEDEYNGTEEEQAD